MAKKYNKKKKSKYPGYMSFTKGLGLNPAYGEDGGGLTGMMKARLAYAQMHGNPSAQRMVAPVDNPYVFEDGNTGTHYMASMGEYAVPQIQNINNNLVLGNYGPESLESIRFDRPEDAEYFAENYKQIAPALRKNGGWLDEFEEGGFMGKTTVEAGGAKHVVYTGKKGDIMVTHPEMDNGAWDTINLTEVSDAKSLAQGVDATLDWHRKHPYHKKKKAEGGFMSPLDLNPATLKKYTKAVKIQENEGKVGFNPKTGLWTPHESVEKGNPTIAYGHKLKAGEDFSKGITEAQALKMLGDDIKYHEQNAKSVVDEKFGKGTFDSLHQDKQMLLTDYSFNGVLSEFPLFTEGLVEGDKKKMFGQYKRYTKDLPLKKRNAWTLEVLEGIPSKEEEKKQDFDRRVQEELDKLTKEREYQAKPWYSKAYDYVKGVLPFEEGGYIYQEGGRTPIYVDPSDPIGMKRYQAYTDSSDVYNLSRNITRAYPNIPQITKQKYKELQEKNDNSIQWDIDKIGYKEDKKKGIKKPLENYVYSRKHSDWNHPLYVKNHPPIDKYITNNIEDFAITLPNGLIKYPSYVYKGKPSFDYYSIHDPNTGVSRHYANYDNKPELIDIYSSNIKPIETLYYGSDKLVPANSIDLSSTGWYSGVKPSMEEQKKWQNYYLQTEKIDKYKKPVQPYKLKKGAKRLTEEPVATQEVKKEEPIDRSILTYKITELPKEEQRGNQRYVATVVPETYQKYGTGFAERYPLTQEQYDAMGATDTMKSREGKDVPVKYLKKYGGKYRAPKYNDKRIGRGDDGGEVWLYEEGGWLDEL